MLFKAHAPGSLMLLGEYAVLQGKQALVCAIDKRITATLIPRTDNLICLQSALGSHQTTLDQLENVAPFQFVLATLRSVASHMQVGCDIQIESEFSSTIGFASSAAVTVATLAVLAEWLGLEFSSLEKIEQARTIVRSVQGVGSGADVAACVLGGMVAYTSNPLSAEKLESIAPITVLYSGSKTTTVNAIQFVEQRFQSYPGLLSQLYDAIHHCAMQGVEAVRQQDWRRLGDIMNIQQGCMDALGVSTPRLAQLIFTLREQPTILGAKISGSGLGDCVVGLGAVPVNINQIPVAMTMQGVCCEKT